MNIKRKRLPYGVNMQQACCESRGKMEECSKNRLFSFRHKYAKICSIWTFNTIYFINSENFASTGGQSIAANTTTQNNGLASLLGSCDLESFLSYCAFKDVYIMLGANIGYNSIWKLSA